MTYKHEPGGIQILQDLYNKIASDKENRKNDAKKDLDRCQKRLDALLSGGRSSREPRQDDEVECAEVGEDEEEEDTIMRRQRM